MARAAALRPSRSPPVPTLPLLPLFLMLLREAGAQDVEVRVPSEVQGRLGSTVELPCHLLPPTSDVRVRVSQVMWMRQVSSKTSQNLAIFHPTYGPSFPSSKPGQERLWFVMAGQKAGSGPGPAAPEQWEPELRDATLALSGLTVEDEGNYTCEFATFPWGTSRGVTWLKAIAEPKNHAEKQEVTLSLDPLPVARCVSTGGRPPARITWLSTLDGDSIESQTAGPEPGTFTVTSRLTVVPLGRVDGAKVTCKVEHESFEEPILLPVTLSVRYPPEVSISGYDDNWYIGRTEASLHCDVRSNPEPTGYDWSTVSGVFPASALARGSQLIIHSVDRLVNTTFICTVTNAVGTGRAELPVLVRDTPRASPQEVGPVVWGAVGGTLLVLLLLAGGVMAFILLRVKRRRKSPGGSAGGGGGNSGGPGGAGDGADRGSYEAKTQVFGNGGPAFWTPTGPGARRPDGKDDDEEEEEDEKAEVGLMLPPVPLDDDMESQLDGSLISRRAVYV
ncbi:nectin-2 isoform X1 [Suncus etruscus]|uniref:nectin-2 isoform X1 n=1 Tax=Suncus etruscus TaxID=109475 RepID=UPI00210F432D|nr:nectin-2 isoform X1 [Suncus etruscus]